MYGNSSMQTLSSPVSSFHRPPLLLLGANGALYIETQQYFFVQDTVMRFMGSTINYTRLKL